MWSPPLSRVKPPARARFRSSRHFSSLSRPLASRRLTSPQSVTFRHTSARASPRHTSPRVASHRHFTPHFGTPARRFATLPRRVASERDVKFQHKTGSENAFRVFRVFHDTTRHDAPQHTATRRDGLPRWSQRTTSRRTATHRKAMRQTPDMVPF